MFVSFVCVCCLGFSSPSSCISFPQLQTDRRVLSGKTCQWLILSVLIKKDCLKGKACSKVKFLKDFQSFDILTFEKSVEEMMLGSWRLLLMTWICVECLVFFDGREGDLQGVTRGKK